MSDVSKYGSTFEEWMRAVEHVMVMKIGLGPNDMADARWRDWFEEGFTVQQAIEEAAEYWQQWGEIPGEIADMLYD